jgi:elongation factor G
VANISDIRNIVLLGHGSSGKTSIAEAMLHITGMTNRLGSVDDKSSISDFDEEEKQRGHSLHSTPLYVNYRDKLINVIDTPGYPDFIGPAIMSAPAAETAVVVIGAAAGIEINTRKLYQVAESMPMPRVIVINKIDAENADLVELIRAVQETFGPQCRCANLPKADKSGVIDCISGDSGDSPVMSVAKAHTELLESAIEADDKLMESYLGGETISTEQVAQVFVKALLAGTIVPILFTNARKEVGIKELLDFVVDYLPSPLQGKPMRLKNGDQVVEVKPDPAGPLVGRVFRISYEPRSNMKYATMRIYSGTLRSDSNMIRSDDRKGIRPGHILKTQGAESKEVPAGEAGDIVTLAKLDELKLGDLIHDGSAHGTFVTPKTPEPMFSLALEPAARGDEQKIGTALEKLLDEDPCFKTGRDQQTKELVISGLGDLHLRVMLSKLEKRFKLAVNTKQPKIPYRETITAKADGHYRHKKQTGGAGQFGEVYLRVEPAQRGSDPSIETTWDVFGGAIPSQFEPAIIKGIMDVVTNGYLAGYPMQDIKVSIYDGKYHPVDSKEIAFRTAGKGAFQDAVSKAKPVLLEPIVNIEITVPSENVGDITGDLSGRRGRVQGQEMLAGGMIVIKAQVPLSEITNYNSSLKSVTAGQGSYSMTLSHYDVVPPQIQQQVIAAYQKNRQAEREE